jgi:uncharacterized protein YbjT (DUF2867 family)
MQEVYLKKDKKMTHTFAIIGATGNIGHVLTEELLKKGHKVHAIGRDKTKLQKLKDKGAETFAISLEDSNALADVFKGCDAVFSFIPPSTTTDNYEEYQNKVGEAIVQAIKKAKINHVLNLSSIGAQHAEGLGPVNGLHHHEKRLNAISGLNVLHFRPGYFMENFLMYIPLIKNAGIFGSLLPENFKNPVIATRDIGVKAAEFLDKLKFTGQSIFEFVGPKEISMSEVTSIIGKAIGKPDLKYKQFSAAEAEKGMLAQGIKPSIVKMLVEMYQSISKGKLFTPTQQITPEHKAKTTFEEFSKKFAEAYNAKTAEHLAHSHR